MKKNALTNAVIAGIAGVAGIASVANAVNLNPDGLGQVLIYPYYTVNGGNNTLISVVNTTGFGKAVKVRFLEGRNSREVLDFNLYLSPYDAWSASLEPSSATGPARIKTSDTSCTVPAIPAAGENFRNYAYVTIGGTTVANNDSGPDTLDRTREGHFEMIEMAIITNEDEDSLEAITHVNGTPADCAQVRDAWRLGSGNPYWRDPAAAGHPGVGEGLIDTLPPTTENGGGGLFGSAALIDFAEGIEYGYNAYAIDGFTVSVIHTRSGDLLPSLASANFPLAQGSIEASVFDNGELVQVEYPLSQRIDAVSAVFMHDSLFNEYFQSLDSATSKPFQSEWVVTFPTKRFYVDGAIVGNSDPLAVDPFQYVFPITGTRGTAPMDIALDIFDREERNLRFEICEDPEDSRCLDFSPTIPGFFQGPQLFWETQVLTFNQSDLYDENTGFATTGSRILGSMLTRNVDTQTFSAGWMRLGLWGDQAPADGSLLNLHLSRPDVNGLQFAGLPAVGFWASASKVGGAVALSNFGAAFTHRGSRCTVPSGVIAASACPTDYP